MLDDTLPHLSLETLRTFVTAAELQSFTKAGRAIHRTQSAVSMQLKRLEKDLERRLFERNARTVRLTADGEQLLGYARRLLRLHDEALASFTLPQLTGLVRLGVPDDYATRYLPGVLSRFGRAHPGVRVDVCCEATRELLQRLENGGLDVCLTTGNGSPRIHGAGKPLARIPLHWIGAHDLHLDTLWNRNTTLPLAVFHEGCIQRRWALEALEHAGIPYRIAFSSVSLAAILAAVRTGLAVSPMLRSCLSRECRVLPQDCGLPPLPDVTVLLHVRKAPDLPAVECLARFVEECFAETD